MMKLFVVVALLAALVYADGYKIEQPKYPCDFSVKIYQKVDDKKTEYMKYKVNGRYMYYKTEADDDMKVETVVRPDIEKKVAGVDCIAQAAKTTVEGVSACVVTYVPVDTVVGHTTSLLDEMLEDILKHTYKNKKSMKFDGKSCDAYYDDDVEEEAIFVYDDFVYGIRMGKGEEGILEYEWKAPMEEFVFDHKDCVAQEKKLADEPSEDYVFCAAASVKVALVALLVALVSALF